MPRRVISVTIASLLLAGCATGRGEPIVQLRPECGRDRDGVALVCDEGRVALWDDRNPVPEYPQVILNAGVELTATLSFRISRDGTVDTSSIKFNYLSKVADQYLVLPLRAALRKWRFAKKDLPTRPVDLSVQFRIATGICADPKKRFSVDWLTIGSPALLRIDGCSLPSRPSH
ncbi:MAG: hypothetical protein ABIZ70_14265 [Gemmatimonadales bacterium]